MRVKMKEVMTKDRTLKWWYIGVIILIVCGVGLFIYQSYVAKDDKKTEPTPTMTPTATATPTATPIDSVELDVNSTEVKNIFANLDSGLGMYSGNYVYFRNQKFEVKDFTNEEVYAIAVRSMDEGIPGREKNFTKDQLEQKIRVIFGANYQFTHQTYSNCPMWEYNSGTMTYEFVGSGCGGTGGPGSLKRVEKAVKKGTTVETNVRVIIGGNGFYKDYGKTMSIEGLELDQYGALLETESNFAKGGLYKVIFEYQNGNYVFISSELIE